MLSLRWPVSIDCHGTCVYSVGGRRWYLLYLLIAIGFLSCSPSSGKARIEAEAFLYVIEQDYSNNGYLFFDHELSKRVSYFSFVEQMAIRKGLRNDEQTCFLHQLEKKKIGGQDLWIGDFFLADGRVVLNEKLVLVDDEEPRLLGYNLGVIQGRPDAAVPISCSAIGRSDLAQQIVNNNRVKRNSALQKKNGFDIFPIQKTRSIAGEGIEARLRNVSADVLPLVLNGRADILRSIVLSGTASFAFFGKISIEDNREIVLYKLSYQSDRVSRANTLVFNVEGASVQGIEIYNFDPAVLNDQFIRMSPN